MNKVKVHHMEVPVRNLRDPLVGTVPCFEIEIGRPVITEIICLLSGISQFKQSLSVLTRVTAGRACCELRDISTSHGSIEGISSNNLVEMR